jgi:hypothetical protein
VTTPPLRIFYTLEEATTLLWDLENARDALIEVDALSCLAGVEQQIVVLHRKLFEQGGAR